MKVNNMHIFYHINIDNKSTGGIINFLRGFVEKIQDIEHITYYSLDYGRDYEGYNNIKKIYFKKMNNNANVKTKIPNNLIYILCLIKNFAFKNFEEDSLLLFNRADHVLPLLLKRGKKILIGHGSSENDKIYYKGQWLKRAYITISERLSIKYMDAVVLVSMDGLQYYEQKYKKYSNKFHYIPTFYDDKKFYNKDIVKNNDCINYIYTGRFVKVKGMYELLEYVKYLNSNNINFKLTMIGEGELEYIFEGQKNVQIVHNLKQEEVCDYLNNSDIFLFFSYMEGTPLSLIESMAVGTAAITSNFSEFRNIIKDEYNGFKIDNIMDNFDDILNKSYLIKNNHHKFRDNCIEFSLGFEISKVLKQWNDLIDSI
jgi:glycosyltransferase involved in cell wall biosynthesis